MLINYFLNCQIDVEAPAYVRTARYAPALMVSSNEGTVEKACENKQTCLFVDIMVAMVRLQGNGHFEPSWRLSLSRLW